MEASAFALERSARTEPGSRRTSSVRLVIIEDARQGFWGPAVSDGGEETVLIARGEAEDAEHFAARAERKIRSIEQSRRTIELAIMVLEPKFGPELLARRLLVGRALMLHAIASRGGCSELRISTTNAARTAEVQAGLVSFVDALLAEPASSALPIVVHTQLTADCLTTRPPTSGRKLSPSGSRAVPVSTAGPTPAVSWT